MQLFPALRIVLAGWYLIAVGLVVGGATGALASALTTPVFSSQTRLFISVAGTPDPSASDLAQGSTAAQQKIRSYLDLITSPIVLEPAIAEAGDAPSTAGALASRVSASSPTGSTIVSISVEDDDPAKAADLSEAVARSFTTVVTTTLERPTAEGGATVSITEIAAAQIPQEPVTPRTGVNVLLGAVLGTLAGAAAVYLLAALSTRFRSMDDLASAFSEPVVGDIQFDGNSSKRPLIVLDDVASPRAESYRSLRTNVQFLGARGTSGRTIAVTSSRQSEGKTTTAANLAITLAESGMRVVVVDGDLRRPNLANTLGLEGAVGLSDLLVGRVELADVLQPWGRMSLDVLPAGTIPPNPSELIGSEAMTQLVNELSLSYDVVVVDTPPLLAVTDAALVSSAVSSTLLVVAAKQTRRSDVQRALAALDRVGTSAAGLILTKSRRKRSSEGYYYDESSKPDEPSGRAEAELTAPPRADRQRRRTTGPTGVVLRAPSARRALTHRTTYVQP